MSPIDDFAGDSKPAATPPEPAISPAEPATPEETPRGVRFLQGKIALALVVVIALAFFFWPRGKSERKILDGYLMDESGAPVALASRLGPATLVHFWATWCPPCRQEIPSLLQFVGEVGPERLGLVLVAVADERDRAVKFVGNPRHPVLFDPVWDVAHRFRTRQLPETHLVVGGHVVVSLVGASDWHSAAVRQAILSHLEERERRRIELR